MEKLTITLLLLITSSHALMPLRGIIYGNVKDDQLYDPLNNIFEHRYESIDEKKMSLVDLKIYDYLALLTEGENLKNSCEKNFDSPSYLNQWEEIRAKRGVVSTFQYISLDVLTRAIAKYARELNWSKPEYSNLVSNLTQKMCSQNLSVYSLKLLQDNLMAKFEGENGYQLPHWDNSQFFPQSLQGRVHLEEVREREFASTVKLFRNICSWNGNVENYRMMTPYLKNSYLMSFIFRNLEGKEIYFNFEELKLVQKDSKETVQVVCQNMICRKTDQKKFLSLFPRMIGSSSLHNDFERLYCHHFKKLKVVKKTPHNLIAKWQGERSSEEEILENSQLIALFTGGSDLLFTANKYSDLKDYLSLAITQRWDKWADENLSHFDNDLLYEEALQIEVKQKPLAKKRMHIDLEITLGEADRGMSFFDKLAVNFHMNFSKDFVKYVWRQMRESSSKEKAYQRQKLMHYLHEQVKVQLLSKQARIVVTPWSQREKPVGGLEEIIVPELLRQLNLFKFEEIDSLATNISIPVSLHYGNFALKYMNDKFNYKFKRRLGPLTLNK